jgi:hypothetical protein
MARKVIGILCLFVVGAGLAGGAEPTDALTIRLVRPDRQLERLIMLFEGSRAPHPAAALAAWKRATRDPKGLGKSLEAAIAALNPGMVRELRNFDAAKIGLGLDPGDGHARWYVVAPNDDGALAALTTAMTLTDGGSDSPYLRIEVDRLGRPGSPLSLRLPGVLALAGSRADLPSALDAARAEAPEPPAPAGVSGSRVRLDPDALPVAGPVSRRRLAEAIRASGLRSLEGNIGIDGETAELAMTGEFEAAFGGSTLEPARLDWVPSTGLIAAGVFSLDPSPPAWDALFSWADRVERADPANAQLAPLRTRLNLLSIAAGVRPEVDLFPQVRGVTAFVTAGQEGDVETIVVALHVADAPAAGRLANHFVPRVASSFLKGSKPEDQADGIRRLGEVLNRPIVAAQRGSTLLIGWGKTALVASLAAKSDPDRSLGTTLRALGGSTPPHRLGAVWPGRLDSPLLAGAPPVVWIGRNESQGKATRDVVRWAELRGVVRRFLERVPLEPSSVPDPGAIRPSR